jgi:hypothetical protein
MSEELKGGAPPANEPSDDEASAPESEAVRALLKRSLGAATAESERPPDLLRGVQKRIRQRSKGKFYSDGWSTTQTRVNYALIAALMLLLVAVAYFALGPTDFH